MARTTTASSKAAALAIKKRQDALGRMRKACISLFKMMVPEHPEALVERHRVYQRFLESLGDRDRLNVISLAFVGKDDLIVEAVHDDVQGEILEAGGMDLLVQREGSDAFLDPRQAIKVVRRKYSMMNLVNSMNLMMGRRNIFSVSLTAKISEEHLAEFCSILHRNILEDRDEELDRLKRDMKRFDSSEVELFMTEYVVGQSLKLPWRLKVGATLLRERLRRVLEDGGRIERSGALRLLQTQVHSLGAADLRAWLLYGEKFAEAFENLYIGDMLDDVVECLDDRILGLVITALLADYHKLRREHLNMGQGQEGGEDDDEEAITSASDFLSRANKGKIEVGERLLLHASALDRIQRIVGRARFLSMAKAARIEDFQRGAAEGQAYDELAEATDGSAWERAVQQAYSLGDPAYRAKALLELAEKLQERDEVERAVDLVADAYLAALELEQDAVPILTEVLGSLIAVGDEDRALQCLERCIDLAHGAEDPDQRARELMLTTSSLLESNKVSPALRSRYTEAIVGEELQFWGSRNITGSLVEGVLGQMDLADPRADLLARKLLTHDDSEVRCSTIRMLPFASPVFRDLVLGRITDGAPDVRIEVMERIGYSRDAALGAYLVAHLRRNHQRMDDKEKRLLALNLARIDARRYLAAFNLMLGSVGSKSEDLVGQHKPYPDDLGLQLAGLEVLYRLNTREARRIIWEAQQAALPRSEVRRILTWAWEAVKHKPYGDPELPRSRLHPEWVPEDEVELLSLIRPEGDEEFDGDEEDGESGLLGRISRRARTLLKTEEEELAEEEAAEAEEEAAEAAAAEAEHPERRYLKERASGSLAPGGTRVPGTPVVFALRARLRQRGVLVDDLVGVTFRLYDTMTASNALWEEAHPRVVVQKGVVAELLGVYTPLPERLPAELFLGISVHGGPEMHPRLPVRRHDLARQERL